MKLLDYCMFRMFGGPELVELRWVINVFKGLTWAYIVTLMYIYQNFSLGAYLYVMHVLISQLAFHGSYGILWLVKDFVFPDKSWQRGATLGSIICGSGFLILYWMIGFLQISGRGLDNPTNGRVITAVASYVFGVTLMMVTDCQKYYTLKYKRGLITDGMFKYNRNPNYTGEMMLYASFAMLTGNYLSYGILLTFWTLLFYPNMVKKDISFSKKEGWAQYKIQSSLFVWRLFRNDWLNYGTYGVLAAFFWQDY